MMIKSDNSNSDSNDHTFSNNNNRGDKKNISTEVIMRTAMISITAIMKMPMKATR